MGNLDFSHNAGFSWYCLFLMFSGIALLLIAVLKNQRRQRRIVQALFGIGFFGYGFYLTFLFGGGSYFIFFYAFIVPVMLIVNAFRGDPARRVPARPPVGAGMASMPPPNLQPMTGPSVQPIADPGLQPMADPGLPPMDPGLPPAPPR
jgi:hypothetical protein